MSGSHAGGIALGFPVFRNLDGCWRVVVKFIGQVRPGGNPPLLESGSSFRTVAILLRSLVLVAVIIVGRTEVDLDDLARRSVAGDIAEG
jgi:hypothetical protein